jgi:predicted SprT family Zn-dependent metalloprotease
VRPCAIFGINTKFDTNGQQYTNTILHELQHVILFRSFGRIAKSLGELQEKEFARVREGAGRITLTDNERDRARTKAYTAYKSQFDEIESFNVSDRNIIHSKS